MTISVCTPSSSLLLDGTPFHDGIPPLFFVLADAFRDHLKREDADGAQFVLHQHHIYGLCFASGINQRNRLAMHEASNYILTSLGLEPDPLEEPEPRQPTLLTSARQEANGHVYVLSNQSLPGLLKIGYTCLTVAERVRQLSRSTSIPRPFEVVASFETATPIAHEAEIHALLAMHRTPGREFFSIGEVDAVAACKAVIKAAL